MRNLVVGGLFLVVTAVGCTSLKDVKVKGADFDLVNDFYTQCIDATRKAVAGVADPIQKGDIAKKYLDNCYSKFSGPILARIADSGK